MDSDTIFLCVKPADACAVLREISPGLGSGEQEAAGSEGAGNDVDGGGPGNGAAGRGARAGWSFPSPRACGWTICRPPAGRTPPSCA